MSRKTKGERLLAKLNAIEAAELGLAPNLDRFVPTKHGFTLFDAAGAVVYEDDTRGEPPLPARDVARHMPGELSPQEAKKRQKATEQHHALRQELDALL